jgi:protein-S-isoprenylcysteine O-methyltransferase Ste14
MSVALDPGVAAEGRPARTSRSREALAWWIAGLSIMVNIAYAAGFFSYSDPVYALHYLDRQLLVQGAFVAFAGVIWLWFHFQQRIATDRWEIAREKSRGHEVELRIEEQLRNLGHE